MYYKVLFNDVRDKKCSLTFETQEDAVEYVEALAANGLQGEIHAKSQARFADNATTREIAQQSKTALLAGVVGALVVGFLTLSFMGVFTPTTTVEATIASEPKVERTGKSRAYAFADVEWADPTSPTLLRGRTQVPINPTLPTVGDPILINVDDSGNIIDSSGAVWMVTPFLAIVGFGMGWLAGRAGYRRYHALQ